MSLIVSRLVSVDANASVFLPPPVMSPFPSFDPSPTSPLNPSPTRDLKKVGVTIVGPQKKIVSSLKALDSHAKNGPVPV